MKFSFFATILVPQTNNILQISAKLCHPKISKDTNPLDGVLLTALHFPAGQQQQAVKRRKKEEEDNSLLGHQFSTPQKFISFVRWKT